jgi:Glycosyl hydrolase family 79, N-terminal domain
LYAQHIQKQALKCVLTFCRAVVTFGLNALHGRRLIRKGHWGGAWNSTNARDFIEYTTSKDYPVDSWEFGKVYMIKKISVFSLQTGEFMNDI